MTFELIPAIDLLGGRQGFPTLELEEDVTPLGVGLIEPADLALGDLVGGLAREGDRDPPAGVVEAMFEDPLLDEADDFDLVDQTLTGDDALFVLFVEP